MQYGAPFRYFALLVGLLCVINMLVMNDFALLWSGAESALAWDSIGAEARKYLPALVQNLMWKVSGGNLFVYRLPSVAWLLAAAAGFYYLARPLFGGRAAILALLVAGASLGAPQLAKIASADSMLLALHLLAFVLLLRYLKQPALHWRIAFYALVLLAGLIHPYSTLILFMIGPGFMYLRHPQGKRLWSLQPWVAAGIAYGIGWWSGTDLWNPPYFSKGAGYEQYLFIVFGSFIPFAGFLIAGLRDYLPKLRKGDEMAIVLIFWFLAAFMGRSPVAAIPLAILIARQMDAYFQPNYPYAAFVKTGALLHLIIIFFGAIALMMGGLHYFGGLGFRAGLTLAAAYWSMSFLGVIGLYGMKRRLVIGGPVLAGALAVLLFWLQVFPLLEDRRKAELELLSEIPAQTDANIYVHYNNKAAFPNLAIYARQRLTLAKVVPRIYNLPAIVEGERTYYLIARQGELPISSTCKALRLSEVWVGDAPVGVWLCERISSK